VSDRRPVLCDRCLEPLFPGTDECSCWVDVPPSLEPDSRFTHAVLDNGDPAAQREEIDGTFTRGVWFDPKIIAEYRDAPDARAVLTPSGEHLFLPRDTLVRFVGTGSWGTSSVKAGLCRSLIEGAPAGWRHDGADDALSLPKGDLSARARELKRNWAMHPGKSS
jgi:hypothetical protein